MLNAIIVDDEKKGRDLLEMLLKENCPTINVIEKVGSAENAFNSIVEKKPDLVFLDIEMPDQTGFELLERFDNIDFAVVFVTAYDKYAIQAFKFSAVDYILKPIDDDALIKAVAKVYKKEQASLGEIKGANYNYINLKADTKKIAIVTREDLMFVEIKNIIHCEASGKDTWVYLNNNEKILSNRSLREFEQFLSEYDFIRVHNSHLINTVYIQSYKLGRTGVLTMKDGSTVEVSQRKKNDFFKKINKI